jgi:ribonucleoside-diphosphate reductase alpha chain
MTGIASGGVLNLDMSEASLEVNKMNRQVAFQIGINKAARTTCVKPAGTTSLTLGTSSGIHAWHNEYYLRRIRVGKNEAIYHYLANNLPELIEDDKFIANTAVISIPQKAPEGAITRHESAFDLLERVKKVSQEWVRGGHQKGSNGHNVSATISIKDNEWDSVGEWMWENKEHYNGLSVLPYDGGTYVQAPFEDCNLETYESMLQLVKNVDLDLVIETEDETDLSGEIACGGGSCEIF